MPASWDSCTASTGTRWATYCAIWSPCGQFIAVDIERTIEVRDSSTLERVSVLKPPGHLSDFRATSLAFSPNGCLLACSYLLLSSGTSDMIVWDAHTGVVIKWIKTSASLEIILFHGDQRTVTCFTEYSPNVIHYFTYDIFNGIQLCSGRTEIWNHGLGTHWAHGDTLWSAMCSWTNDHFVVNIYELQPTSISPLHVFSSFLIPHQNGQLSFSPISFHASFVTKEKVIILDVQNSKLLLQTDLAQAETLPGQFSPNGHFFACIKSKYEIGVWQNTPSGYMPWSSLRSRSVTLEISWSPASTSILCRGHSGVWLLCLDSCLRPLSPSRIGSMDRPQNHLVVYSADQVHIIMAQQSDSIITILNHHLGTSQQLIDIGMQICDIKIVNNTIFVADEHILASWDLEASGITYSTHGTRRMIHGLPDPGVFPGSDWYWGHLVLSHDCSWIAVPTYDPDIIYLFDVKTQKGFSTKVDDLLKGTWFSLDGHQLWFQAGNSYYFVELEAPGNWDSLNGEDQVNLKATQGDGKLLFSHSSHGYSCEIDSKWIVDPQGRNILWLPPNWRFSFWEEARWDGNFLALLHGHHPEPIIIEFQL